jgi:hypothetical protein
MPADMAARGRRAKPVCAHGRRLTSAVAEMLKPR